LREPTAQSTSTLYSFWPPPCAPAVAAGILCVMGHKAKKKKKTLAAKADKYALYQRAVQAPEAEIEFFDKVFKRSFARRPLVLREDFCGTAAVCCAWADSRKDRIAYGVDLDPEPLVWGAEHNLTALKPRRRERVILVESDVRADGQPAADIVTAENFSYCVFRTRKELLRYFRAAHAHLAEKGLFILDAMGGSLTYEEGRREKRKVDGFHYIWEQRRFDPITHHARMHIHFAFVDGSRLNKAFTYDWRLWTLPELQELLSEAGFDAVAVHWEGTNKKTGEGNGRFRPQKHAAADPSWICYIVARKGPAEAKSD